MLDQFADLGQFYPGSRERRQTTPVLPAPVVEDELGEGTILYLHGTAVEFFTIGQVARAIGRTSGTLRAWEARGVLPKSGYQTSSDDPRGVRRLYTRAQAAGILRLAKDCGVMDADSRRPLHEFKAKVWALFNELKGGKR